MFEIRDNVWSIMQQSCGDVDNYALWIDYMVKDYNPCTRPATTNTDYSQNGLRKDNRQDE
jgi:hypothetical protein